MSLQFWGNCCHHHRRDWSHAATAASFLDDSCSYKQALIRFFYPGTQRHTVWYSTCRLTLGFKEIRACLVFQFLYFLFSKLLEIFFLKIIFETSFQNTIFTAFVFGSYFLKQVFKKRKPKLVFGSYFWKTIFFFFFFFLRKFWKQILISLKETTYSVGPTNFQCIYGVATKCSSQFLKNTKKLYSH